MSYIDENLLPGEKVLHRASVHWVVYMPGAMYFALCVVMALYLPSKIPAIYSQYFHLAQLLSLLLVLAGGFSLLKAFIYVQTTEFVVTNMRVVAKTGWMSRNVVELRFDKIEGLNMQQTVNGRIWGYGTLVLSGTGGDKTYINMIGDPSHFCNHAMATIQKT